MIARYRKKPDEVDTVQWTGDNEAELTAFTDGRFAAVDQEDRTDDPEMTGRLFEAGHSTWIGVYTGQHILRTSQGEHRLVTDGELAEEYEPVPRFSKMRLLTTARGFRVRWREDGNRRSKDFSDRADADAWVSQLTDSQDGAR